VDAGHIFRLNSSDRLNIFLIQPKNLARPHVRSLRSPFSDRLLDANSERTPIRLHNIGCSVSAPPGDRVSGGAAARTFQAVAGLMFDALTAAGKPPMPTDSSTPHLAILAAAVRFLPAVVRLLSCSCPVPEAIVPHGYTEEGKQWVVPG
jgi:hypothetical protein